MFKPVEQNINFPAMEKKWLVHWYKKGIVKKYINKNNPSSPKLQQEKKMFSFLDGPITANNPMGVHHAWGRTYKDLWQKFNNLLGYRERFQNGFDCQGLWVEVEVEKELGLKNKKQIEELVPGDKKASIAKFVDLCKKRVYKFSKIQMEQSKRLGYFMDWDHSYFTMSDENNYMIWHFLKICYKNGWIYKGHESVPWCPRCETAISEHEILTEDYKELVHESVYLKLRITEFEIPDTYLLIWTTTPWTIPANIAVAVDEKLDYSLVKTDKGDVWIAKDAIKRVVKSPDYKIVKTVKGKKLVGLKYEGPFDNLPAVQKVARVNPKTFHTVIPTDERIMPISIEEGTGLVHTAVSAGTEDFQLGKKLGLPMIPVIADNADYLSGLGFLSGKNAKKNPRLILDYLEMKSFAFEIFKYKHRYPACWRCKSELVWKVADEWYIAMDKPAKIRPVPRSPKDEVGNPTSLSKFEELKGKSDSSLEVRRTKWEIRNLTLRQRMIEVAKKINWMPEFGLARELDWLKNMHDWLISKKNRYWGLALPVYECKKCGNFEIIGSKKELKERAVAGWEKFAGHTPHKPYIDEVVIKCSKCGGLVRRIDDVGNPWLDAGIVGFSSVKDNNQGEPLYFKNKEEWSKWIPADFITESFPGQFKNWFYALIAESTVLENGPQFKTVLGFGTMLDEKARPFHKSAGNAIEFVEGADRFGADIIRWVCCSENPANNVLFGEHKVTEVKRQFYLILWNTYKFFVEYANLDKFKSQNSKVKTAIQNSKLNFLDRWILSRLTNTISLVESCLKKFNAKDATAALEKFVSDLSTWYIRRSRDRVWVNSSDEQDKLIFYRTLHYVLVNLSIIISPFLPFISEEMFTNLTGLESVHLTSWPVSNDELRNTDNGLETKMELVRKIVEAGHSVRKEKKLKVRQPLAGATVSLKKILENKQLEDLIMKELNVKKLTWKQKRGDEIIVDYDTKLTKELQHEGKLREVIRQIQQSRKQLGVSPEQQIRVVLPKEFAEDKSVIQNRVSAKEIKIGDSLDVKI